MSLLGRLLALRRAARDLEGVKLLAEMRAREIADLKARLRDQAEGEHASAQAIGGEVDELRRAVREAGVEAQKRATEIAHLKDARDRLARSMDDASRRLQEALGHTKSTPRPGLPRLLGEACATLANQAAALERARLAEARADQLEAIRLRAEEDSAFTLGAMAVVLKAIAWHGSNYRGLGNHAEQELDEEVERYLRLQDEAHGRPCRTCNGTKRVDIREPDHTDSFTSHGVACPDCAGGKRPEVVISIRPAHPSMRHCWPKEEQPKPRVYRVVHDLDWSTWHCPCGAHACSRVNPDVVAAFFVEHRDHVDNPEDFDEEITPDGMRALHPSTPTKRSYRGGRYV